MNEPKKTEAAPPPISPRLAKLRNDLERVLRDYDLSQQDYSALIDDLNSRRRRIEGEGDNIFDDIVDE
jgi:hypothetical protein